MSSFVLLLLLKKEQNTIIGYVIPNEVTLL